MQREIQARHEVLLDPQLRHVERMADVFGMHQQTNLTVDGHGHLGGDDVILRVRIMVRVKSEEVLSGFVDQIGMDGTELAIGTRIAEIKGELPGLDLNRHGVSAGLG